jgi:hypothetical protein
VPYGVPCFRGGGSEPFVYFATGQIEEKRARSEADHYVASEWPAARFNEQETHGKPV